MAAIKKSAGAGRGSENPTRSGYSKGDEKGAAAYKRDADTATKKSLGATRGSEAIKKGATGNARNQFLENTKSDKGRALNKTNTAYMKREAK